MKSQKLYRDFYASPAVLYLFFVLFSFIYLLLLLPFLIYLQRNFSREKYFLFHQIQKISFVGQRRDNFSLHKTNLIKKIEKFIDSHS